MADFKTIPLRPMTGAFDVLSSADEIGYGNFRVVKNATTRSTRNRQRGGGWVRAFYELEPYNNHDLHDQLLGRLLWFDSYPAHAMGGGGISGYGYPYNVPSYTNPAYELFDPATQFYCGAYIGDYPDFVYNGCNVFYPFVGYPHNLVGTSHPCGTQATQDYPSWLHSYFYTSCPVQYDAVSFSGFVYGEPFPFYAPQLAYDYVYLGDYPHYRVACREAITMLNEIVTATGRTIIASTMSRVYELNQAAGNWRILADGLGNAGYAAEQCGCNSVRGVSATMGGYLLYTNNFDPPMIYFVGDEPSGGDLRSLQVITDLQALGISRAGGVVVWKGFVLFFDLTENSERFTGDIIWSDLEAPANYIASDVSLAGRVTIAIGERILAGAPLGNAFIFYTDKSIIRMTLVGGLDVFNFERIYRGGDALKYKYSLINAGDVHVYLGESDVYVMTQLDARPLAVPWMTKAAAMIFNGIHEDDAEYQPMNTDVCDLVTGGWSDEKHEAWLSWCSGSNTCPDVTLRFNLKFGTADFVDAGFTAYWSVRADLRPTIGQWIEDLGICPRGTHVAAGVKDGPVCSGAIAEVANPPLYIRNPEEDPALPVHPDSLCARLEGKTIDDFCQDCSAPTRFIMASTQDFALKQFEDEIYYRERLGFGSNPCRDFTFPTESGTAAGLTGAEIQLDTWLDLGELNCLVSNVTMVAKFSPCATAGGLGYSEFFETVQAIGWQSSFSGIAVCDSLDRVIADSTDNTGIALINFNASPPALDYVLPLNTPFTTKGLFYHPKADVIIVWVRYGTAPGYIYRLAFMDPVNGLSSEVDLGIGGGFNEYDAHLCPIGFSTIGILLRSLTAGVPHLMAVLDTDTRTVVVSKFFENVGGTIPVRDFTGICYSCELEQLVSVGIKYDPALDANFRDYLMRFDLATLAITDEFLLPDSLDIHYWNPIYINSTRHVIVWDVNGYYDIDPSNGTLIQFDSLLVGNVNPAYHWKIDRYLAFDGGGQQAILYNPNDFSKTTVPVVTALGNSWDMAVSRTTGKFYIHDGLFSPFLIHQFDVQ